MVRIIPTKGDPFVVNSSHILSLSDKNNSQVENISVRDWLKKPKSYKYQNLYRVGVSFPPKKELPFPPYAFGIWLYRIPSGLELDIMARDKVSYDFGVAYDAFYNTYKLIDEEVVAATPRLFRDSNENKHIPIDYLLASKEDRSKLLAAIIDSVGSLKIRSKYKYFQIELNNERKSRSDSILFLARSLGFAAYRKEIKRKYYSCQYTKYQINLYGDFSTIPTRRYSSDSYDVDTRKKSVLLTHFRAEILPKDDYFGFTVDGDNLYVMGDFTVTHNSGKSFIAVTLGRLFGNTFLCTPQKMLQNQYMQDFPQHLFELKGRVTYPCLRLNHEEWVVDSGDKPTDKRKKKKKGPPRDPIQNVDFITLADWNDLPPDHIWRQFNCGNAPCNTRSNGGLLKKECKKHNVCEYIKRRDYAMNISKFSLLNFSNMLLFSLLIPDVYAKRPLLIMDESHTLESFLYEKATITVGVRQLKPLQEHMENPEDLDRIRKPFECMDDMIAYIQDVLFPAYERFKAAEDVTATEGIQIEDPIEEATENPKDDKRILKRLIHKLKDFIEKDEPTDRSYVLVPDKGSSGKNLDGKEDVVVGLKIKPFSVAHLSNLAFGPSDSRVLLMSATILDPVTFCQSVGIDRSDVFFIRVPSTFPAENRLIIGDTSVGSMAYKHKETTLPKMLDRILELSEKHSMHKGIIHTGNYENMHKFKRWVADADYTLNERMLFQAQGTFEEKEKLIKIHAGSSEPTILCGPGFLEGIDLKDDLARFNIIMKLPFLSLADPLVKRKAEEFPEWYALQVALALIQAIGRPVRSPVDWAVTYILDLLWKFFYEKNQNRLFPKHIQDAVRWISKRNQLPHH